MYEIGGRINIKDRKKNLYTFSLLLAPSRVRRKDERKV
jgi:hypothetical protein